MNILLTGGAGYIGSHTAVALSEAGHKVVFLDNFCNSHKSVLERLKNILGIELPCIESDIRETSIVKKTLIDFKIDTVIHFAGLKALSESVQKPIEYYENNVQGAISLSRAMQSSGVKNLIFSSSATVYGDPQYLPIDEQHPTVPTNPYGRTKLQIEDMLRDISKADPDWKIICLRYFNPAGAHISGLIGEDPRGTPNNLMPFITNVAIGRISQLDVFGGDYETLDGTGVRDYIHVMDLAEGHLAALNSIDRLEGWIALNLGNGIGVSVLEMISAYEKACDKKIDYRIVGRRKGDIGTCYADVKRANKILSWKAKRSIQDMCDGNWLWGMSNK